ERLADVVRDELNVRRVRFVAAAEELGSYEVKPNYRTLGPVFGKEMPLAAEAVTALDPQRVAAAVRNGDELGIAVGGREHTLTAPTSPARPSRWSWSSGRMRWAVPSPWTIPSRPRSTACRSASACAGLGLTDVHLRGGRPHAAAPARRYLRPPPRARP